MDLDTAFAWAAERTDAVLITIRRDGRPQSSDISYSLDGGVFAISVTEDRAKTKNMQRGPAGRVASDQPLVVVIPFLRRDGGAVAGNHSAR